MFFRMLYDEKLAQASYVIGCQKTGDAIVIDPERDVDRYFDVAAEEDLRITAATETHIHADFLSGCRELADRGVKVYLSGEGGDDWSSRWLDGYDHEVVHDGDVIRIGNIELTVRHTPGHTPEHIAFLVTDRGGGAVEPMGVLSGDFVFVGDLGRPDLLETAAGHVNVKEASARQLAASARGFAELPDFLQLWPGHGAGSACGKALGAVPQSTVGYEKRYNAPLRLAGDEPRFVEAILEGQPEPPAYFGRMKIENRDGPPLLGALPRPRALSPDELAAVDTRSVAVLDTRTWPEFAAAHLDGALFAPLDKSFPTVAGSYVEPSEDIVLIVETARLEEAVRALVRIGLDHVVGYLEPAALGSCPTASTPEISVEDLRRRLNENRVALLDVRRAAEFGVGSIAGATNVSHTQLRPRIAEVPAGGPVAVYCRTGVRSAVATAMLRRAGHDAVNVIGGIVAWEASRAPLEGTVA